LNKLLRIGKENEANTEDGFILSETISGWRSTFDSENFLISETVSQLLLTPKILLLLEFKALFAFLLH